MDKTTIIIVPFLVISILMAGVLMTGFVPKVYETSNQVNTTNFLLQQRIALTEQQQHEDTARDIQAFKISKHVDNEIKKMQENLTEYILASEKRSNISSEQRNLTLQKLDENTEQNSLILESLQNKSDDHAKFSKNMSELQNNVSNLTTKIRDMLKNYGDNSVSKFQDILDRQQEIINKLNNLSKIIH